MASVNDNEGDASILENKFRELVVSEEWMTVDKSKSLKNIDTSVKASQLRPYVPFSVEEVSCTTRLDTWSNCNVRVLGTHLLLDGKHYLESIDEPGGPYKILLICTRVVEVPESDQVVQAFGNIKLAHNNEKPQSFIDVLFFRLIKKEHLSMYRESIECMRKYIPLFIKTGNTENDDDSQNDAEYYKYHVAHDENYTNDINKNELYSDDDFNLPYNTDSMF